MGNEQRRRQARELSLQLREAMGRRLQQKLLPVDGQWLDAEAAQRLLGRNRRRAWMVLVELLLLFVLIGFLAYAVLMLTQTIAY